MKNQITFIIAAGLLILTVLGCGQLMKPVRKSTPDFEISVEQLAGEFKQNESAAGSKYNGKTLAVTGRVDGKRYGTMLVFKTDNRRDGFLVQCFFDKDGADSYRKIKDGQEVTMLGLCKGRHTNDGPLMITQCILR